LYFGVEFHGLKTRELFGGDPGEPFVAADEVSVVSGVPACTVDRVGHLVGASDGVVFCRYEREFLVLPACELRVVRDVIATHVDFFLQRDALLQRLVVGRDEVQTAIVACHHLPVVPDVVRGGVDLRVQFELVFDF